MAGWAHRFATKLYAPPGHRTPQAGFGPSGNDPLRRWPCFARPYGELPAGTLGPAAKAAPTGVPLRAPSAPPETRRRFPPAKTRAPCSLTLVRAAFAARFAARSRGQLSIGRSVRIPESDLPPMRPRALEFADLHGGRDRPDEERRPAPLAHSAPGVPAPTRNLEPRA
jgi:hypothetical protein